MRKWKNKKESVVSVGEGKRHRERNEGGGRKDAGVIFDVMEKEIESMSKSGRKVERKILMTVERKKKKTWKR